MCVPVLGKGMGQSDDLLSGHRLPQVAEYTSFDQMKGRDNNSMKDFYNQEVFKKDGGFFRKGERKVFRVRRNLNWHLYLTSMIRNL